MLARTLAALDGDAPLPDGVEPAHRAAAACHFDRDHYVSAYPAVLASGLDPLDHFLLHGWRQGFNPSRAFDVGHYLAAHPDVAARGINPLLHYAWAGEREGRAVRRPLDGERRQLEASSAPRSRLGDWAAAADRSAPLRPGVLAARLAARRGTLGVVVSVSHDDYAVHCGGIQSVVGDEQAAFGRAGWSYLHLSPAAPLPMLAAGSEGFAFRIRLDGVAIGCAAAPDVLRAVAGLRDGPLVVVVHHLMGHAPELVAALCVAAGVRPWFWVHDFFTLCPSYALMRNDVRFCGGPAPESGACLVCTFGEDRVEHVERMRALFATVRPLVLAPSPSALELWLRRGNLVHESAEVLPLARLLPDAATGPGPAGRRPLRVAHLGARVTHKGWTVFEELALSLARDGRYAFHHLGEGGGAPLPGCIRHVPVRVGPGRRNAMIEAVAEEGIDVVVSWSLWPETFCFTLHEALAGGAFVVGRAGAGNVGAAMRANAPRQGVSIGSEGELGALFASGAIGELVEEGSRRFGALLRGSGTAERVLGAVHRPAAGGAAGLAGVLGVGLPADAMRDRAMVHDG